MNLVEKVLWVTCVFVIYQHVDSTTEQGGKPKIHSITLSPPRPVEQGGEVFATARFNSSGPVPVRYWEMMYIHSYKKKEDMKDVLEYLSGNEYESKVSLGPVHRAGWVIFNVSNTYGTDSMEVEFGAVLKYRQECNSLSVCGTNNSVCSKVPEDDLDDQEYCICREGYLWDSSKCRPYFFDHCDTSELCQAITNNSECHPEKKKCFCDPGYGIDYESIHIYVAFDVDCIKYPIRKVKKFKLGEKNRLSCKVVNSNLTELLWFHNGQELCTINSTLCSQDETIAYEGDISSYSRGLVPSAVRSGNYTCMAVTSDGGNWTVSETEILIGDKPEIRELTLLPPGRQPRGTEMVAVARIYSLTEKPTWDWRVSYNKENLKEELKVLPDNEYEIRAFLGPIHQRTSIDMIVRNAYGYVTERVNIDVGAKYGEDCYMDSDCLDDNLKCTGLTTRCQCPKGYFWNNSSFCDKRAVLKDSCETSDQCQAATSNSECDEQMKRCFCPKGYPSYYEYPKDICKTDPEREEKSVNFGQRAFLFCQVAISNLSHLIWYRNGKEICTQGSTWCTEEESTKYDRNKFVYITTLTLPNVTRNDSYTCQAFKSDGKNWTMSEIQIIIRAEFKEPCGTSDQCQAVTINSECDDQMKRCFCPAGYEYGYGYPKNKCITRPNFQQKNVAFSETATLSCQVVIGNLSDIIWYRNGKDVCTHGSTWCSQEITTYYNSLSFTYMRSLELPSVIKNDTYTCKAFTSNGKNWRVSETEIKVVGSYEQRTKSSVYGSNAIIDCGLKRPNSFDISLVRDGKDDCTPEATWCSPVGTTRDFQVLNLGANHTFTCEAYSGEENRTIVKSHRILIDTKPQILEMTHSPPGAVQVGVEFFVTARFYSLQKEASVRRWKIDGVEQDRREELRVLSENEYESKLLDIQVEDSSDILFQISDTYGEDTQRIKIQAAVTYGEKCSSTVVCMTNDTVCDSKSRLCLCREGYHSDSGICHKNGAMGVLAVQKEGIIMLALAILFIICRSTSSIS